MNRTHHSEYMSQALHLAEQGRYTVAPNPMVGCIIVKDNRIVGRGYHSYPGGAHAEIIALREAREQAQGATAYLTLEPCCHLGRTPPCTVALIEAGIKVLYASCIDPNPIIAGKGIEILRAAGIRVEIGLGEAEARRLNEIFFYYITQKRPFVIAKWAMSLDGMTKVNHDDRKQISCLDSQHHTHQLRQSVDAILVGANTVLSDNPQLTSRCIETGNIIKSPVRIVLSGKKIFPLNLNIFSSNIPGKTIIVNTYAQSEQWYRSILSEKIQLLTVSQDENGLISLPCLLDALGEQEISSMLVEGGMTVHQNFFNQKLINKAHVYLSPTIISSLRNKQQVTMLQQKQLGVDFHFTADF